MKTSILLTIFVSIFSTSFGLNSFSERKQRPFNDEGPKCEENCGTVRDGRVLNLNFEELIADNAPKPPFNDEGPGGKG